MIAMALQTIDSGAQFRANWDREVRVIGEYYVQDLGRRAIVRTLPDGRVVRSNKAAFVVLEDGSQISLGTRPDEEMQVLGGKRIAVTGTLREPIRRDSRTVARPRPLPYLNPVQSVEPLDAL